MESLGGSAFLREYRVPFTALVVGAGVTAVTSLSPFVHFAYRSPSVHLVLETTAALVALLAAYLLLGRFRTSRRANDLALIYPLGLFAANNVFVSFVLLISPDIPPSALEEWVPALVRLIAATTFALAAFVPPRTIASPVGAARFVVAAVAGTLSVVAMAVTFLSGVLPRALAATPASETQYPTLTGHPLLLSTYAAAALVFGLASVGFARAAARDRDELMLWFSGGAVLAGVASLHYFLFPSRFSDWVYTGDFFRIGFYALLLVGAAREIERYWEERSRAAVLEERRRLARDLHDGVAQELAFMWRQTRRLATGQNGPIVSVLAGSVERALQESRRAVAALRAAPTQSLAAAMAEAVESVASRVGTKVVVEVDEHVDVASELREQLLRIACEAVANAGRHGHANLVRVDVTGGVRPRMTIVDDGAGFDTAAPPRHATFGLLTMRERARELGATLDVTSRPGHGTRVELVLP
jgi:signal transduction histidine kinase